jgi:hypothetical protein
VHVAPQLVPSHVAVPLAGIEHAVQLEPHVAVDMFDTHAPPQLWKPALQVKPHVVPSQVAVAFEGAVHGVQLEPHAMIEVFETQEPPQSWKPALQR